MSTVRGGVAIARPSAWRPVDEADIVAWLHRDAGGRARGVRGTAPLQLERASIAIVRHAPGKRLTARCRLVLAAPNGGRELLTVYAKQYRRLDLARRLARQLRSLRFAHWRDEPPDG